MKLSNRTIWITGASSGVGAGMATVFHREGAHLIVSGRHVPAPEAKELGIIDEIVPGKDLLAEAIAFAKTIADVSAHRAPRPFTLATAAPISRHTPPTPGAKYLTSLTTPTISRG